MSQSRVGGTLGFPSMEDRLMIPSVNGRLPMIPTVNGRPSHGSYCQWNTFSWFQLSMEHLLLAPTVNETPHDSTVKFHFAFFSRRSK